MIMFRIVYILFNVSTPNTHSTHTRHATLILTQISSRLHPKDQQAPHPTIQFQNINKPRQTSVHFYVRTSKAEFPKHKTRNSGRRGR